MAFNSLHPLAADQFHKNRGSIISFKHVPGVARSHENTQKVNTVLGINVRDSFKDEKADHPEQADDSEEEKDKVDEQFPTKCGEYKSYESRDKRLSRWRKLRLQGVVPDDARSHYSRSKSNKKSGIDQTDRSSLMGGVSNQRWVWNPESDVVALAKLKSRCSPSNFHRSQLTHTMSNQNYGGHRNPQSDFDLKIVSNNISPINGSRGVSPKMSVLSQPTRFHFDN